MFKHKITDANKVYKIEKNIISFATYISCLISKSQYL